MNHDTFIENCDIDTIFHMFNHLLPNMKGPVNDGMLSSTLKTFGQVSSH